MSESNGSGNSRSILPPFPYELISESDYSAEQLQQRGRMFAAVMYLDLYSKNLLNTDWDIQKVEKAIAEMLNEESLELIKEFIGVVDSMFGIVIDFDTLMNQLEAKFCQRQNFL